MRNRHKTSPLWSIFTIINESEHTALCSICGISLCYKATTTNLKKHLDRKHPNVNLDKLRPTTQTSHNDPKPYNSLNSDSDQDKNNQDNKDLQDSEKSFKLELNDKTSIISDPEKAESNNTNDEDILTKYITSRFKRIEDKNQKIYAETLITQIISKAIMNQLTANTCIGEQPPVSFNPLSGSLIFAPNTGHFTQN